MSWLPDIEWGHVLWVVLLASLLSIAVQYSWDGWQDRRRKKRGEL